MDALRVVQSPPRGAVPSMASRARVLALRLARDKWGFHASAVVEPCRARAAAVAADLERNSAGPERFLPRFAADAARRAAASFVARFRSWGESPVGSWRRGAHRVGSLALDRIHPDDQVLAALPPACSSVELVYPESAHPDEARRALRELLTDRARAVRTRFRRNAFVGVPLTFPMMFTPLSNLPMYWFGWRAYEQWNAARNADAARRRVEVAECAGAGAEAGRGGAATEAARWVAADAPCARLTRAGDARATGADAAGSGATDGASDDERFSRAAGRGAPFSCCRAAADAARAATLAFVPCAALDASADAPREGEASALEATTGIDELTTLARRYRRVLKARRDERE